MHIIELTKPDGRHLTLYSVRAIAPDPIAASPFPEPPRASPQQVAVHLEDA
jgi:UDPglucose--hexose-1-phosphate uridylyltransferase